MTAYIYTGYRNTSAADNPRQVEWTSGRVTAPNIEKAKELARERMRSYADREGNQHRLPAYRCAVYSIRESKQ